jgi:aspartyl-tRNA(Asn)/glutamyl-tRNA(Gln) amidotransferase subunit A
MISLDQHDARAIARKVSAGRLDPVEVADAFIANIEARNAALNALVGFDAEAARQEAQRVRALLRGKVEALPLAGVPIIIKDNIWVEGRCIAQGSRLFAEHVAAQDAIAVARLRRAGAIIIGIGNCPEFACKGVTNSPLHGIARNPLDLALTPGGSSGGNAAALAAHFAPVALGTDGGGSGRRPPAHTGVVGFKPSFGAIPYGPGFPEPFWGIAVLAPMGRTVGDVAALFEAIAGPDPADPESVLVDQQEMAEENRLRIAFSPKLGLDVPVDADVADAVATAVERLVAAGCRVSRADPVWPPGLSEASVMPLQQAGLGCLHGSIWRLKPDLFDPDIGAQIERGLALQGYHVANALEASQAIKRSVAAFFQDYDLLLTPTAPCVAWAATELGPARIGGVAVPPRAHAVFTPFFNHALAPALSLPCGRGRNSLPVGLQIVARRGRDRWVLKFAAAAERILSASTTSGGIAG